MIRELARDGYREMAQELDEQPRHDPSAPMVQILDRSRSSVAQRPPPLCSTGRFFMRQLFPEPLPIGVAAFSREVVRSGHTQILIRGSWALMSNERSNLMKTSFTSRVAPEDSDCEPVARIGILPDVGGWPRRGVAGG